MVGRQYFGKRDVDLDGSFQYTVQKPTMHRARLITEEIVRAFLERELDEIHIVYTQMQNAMAMENVNMQLLPLAAHDPSDYEGLNKLNEQLTAVNTESDDLEAEWLELSEQLE